MNRLALIFPDESIEILPPTACLEDAIARAERLPANNPRLVR